MDFEILDYVSLDKGLEKKLCEYDFSSSKIVRLSKRYFKGKTFGLNKQNNMTKLAVALKAAEKTLARYSEIGIDEEVFKATVDDIRIWCENCDNTGLNNVGWIKNHISCKLFKIGRLQFQLFSCASPLIDYSKLPFSKGEKLIYVHIPQGEKLSIDACKKSLSMANEFFARYFPKHKYRYYFCESWLLYENNKLFMKENSNIAQFMNLFDVRFSLNNEDQAFERIFNVNRHSHPDLFCQNIEKRLLAVSNLPENTSLQKSAKIYLSSGNKLGTGTAVIDKNTIAGIND
ncbi:MAG: acyltransferase domain-containing protein [Clostridia bacterium]|nr:acyltransferase domain-containing protein [Clostridia bacterium]MDE7329107.1 acyltransferase domain-containing protein [Clostridia bacterium]